MSRWRKKPVVIEAVQWLGNNAKEIEVFIGEKNFYHVIDDNTLIIPTLTGNHKAIVSDWIIKGINGEFYPCEADIFDATYEPVDRSSGYFI